MSDPALVFDEPQRVALVALLTQYLIEASKDGSELPLEFHIIVEDRIVDVNELLVTAMDSYLGVDTEARAKEITKGVRSRRPGGPSR